MAPGKYIGRVRVLSGVAVNPIQTVTVTLTVSATPLLVISPASMTFNMAASGAVPAAQNISVGSTGTPLSFGATYAAATGGNWLTLSPVLGTSPATVQVSVNSVAQTLLPGTYNATVTISSGVDQQTVPVTLTVSSSAVLSSSPASLTFVYQTTKLVPADQFFTVSSSGAPQSFTATATSTGNWLSLTCSAGRDRHDSGCDRRKG